MDKVAEQENMNVEEAGRASTSVGGYRRNSNTQQRREYFDYLWIKLDSN